MAFFAAVALGRKYIKLFIAPVLGGVGVRSMPGQHVLIATGTGLEATKNDSEKVRLCPISDRHGH